jgi:hypothetical protein
MGLKLCVGTSQKIGQPDFGSLGASCEVEIELSPSLLQDDLAAFHRHVRNAYVACHQAVSDELSRQKSDCGGSQSPPAGQPETRPTSSRSNGNNGNGNGSNGHRASQKQRNYANQLAGQIPRLGTRRMEALAQKMFGKPLADLASLDASALIDTLKAIKDEQITLEDALDGAPV